MKRLIVLALTVLALCSIALAQSIAAGPAREYFRYTRDMAIAQPGKQNYLVVDAAIWAHARASLSDLRLYDRQVDRQVDREVQVPYALSAEQASSSTQVREARILNLGVRGRRTEFDLDVGAEAEYNHVQLRVKATNFVATATADGRDAVVGAGRKLSTSTLYDFSREGLGNNFGLRIPLSTFRYLHVSIMQAISPGEIASASTSVHRESQAKWISAGRCHSSEQVGRTTRIACDLDPGVPVGRFSFTVPADLVNFRRTVSVSDSKGTQLCRGSISRIRMKSGGKEVVTDDLALSSCAMKANQIVIEIENGDDTPLQVQKAEPQSLERRIYFDPAGKAAIRLYYGDEKLPAPEYDYANFFHKEPDAVEAVVGAENSNPDYTGRPDQRPWSERHKWVLWGSLLLAVLVLALLALKGLTSGPA
jgi:Protein of unknown function (DUF3999)